MEIVRGVLLLAVIAAAMAASGCKPNRGQETVECTPGAELWIGCNQQCDIGTCSGDPWLRICDGDVAVAECDDDTVIEESDDSTEICFSTCPLVQMVCPASGHVTVTLRGYTGRTSAYTCDWRVEERTFMTFRDGGTRADAGGRADAGADAGMDGGGAP